MIISPITDTIEDETLLNKRHSFSQSHNAHRKLKANNTIKVQRQNLKMQTNSDISFIQTGDDQLGHSKSLGVREAAQRTSSVSSQVKVIDD